MRWPSLGSSPLEQRSLHCQCLWPLFPASDCCSECVPVSVFLIRWGDRHACAHRALKHFHFGLPICPSQSTPASALSKQWGEVVSRHVSARFTEVTDPELTWDTSPGESTTSNPSTVLWRVILVSFYRWGSRGTRRLRDFTKGTRLEEKEVKPWKQLWNSSSSLTPPRCGSEAEDRDTLTALASFAFVSETYLA